MNGHDSIILAAGSNVVTSALDLFSQFAIIGGGLWAVYAARDLLSGGEVLASKGDRIAGSGFDSSKLGGDLFTLSAATVDGRNVVTIEATDRYRALVSDDSHEAGWRAYIQCKRLAVTDRHAEQHVLGRKNLVKNRRPCAHIVILNRQIWTEAEIDVVEGVRVYAP